jgi:hypothetical protein
MLIFGSSSDEVGLKKLDLFLSFTYFYMSNSVKHDRINELDNG